MRPLPSLAAAAVVLLSSIALAGEPAIRRHEIEVRLSPEDSTLHLADTLTVSREGGGKLSFRLNSALEISEVKIDGRAATGLERVEQGDWVSLWRVDVTPGPGDTAVLRIAASGRIADRVREAESLSFVVGDDTRGVVGPEGAYLSNGTAWYPDDGAVAPYDVVARIPMPYMVVTQGTLVERTKDADGTDISRWLGKLPADGLALVAGKWQHFERVANGVTVGAYLSEQNASGADVLLAAGVKYLATYGELLGPYAYDRFDVVENWFTTGYGMPEFTLLGRHVVARMLAESARHGEIPPGYLDHEIVHCWWGNLVYPEYETGNWCEGITTYCANYLTKERQGPEEARAHRLRTNQRFSLRVTPERDYAVRDFRGKSEDFEDDIGYGKCSMLFHMLRRDIGEEAFWGALRDMAKDFAGRRATWDDWRRSFESRSSRNLAAYFAQWLDRKGAPLLAISEARTEAGGGRLRVAGTIRQVLAEGEEPWRLSVPVVVEHLEGREEVVVEVASAQTPFSVLVPSMPLRVEIDPDHHVFRRFAPDEIPACLAATLGRPKLLIVHPDGDEGLRAVAARAAETTGGTLLAASEAPASPPPRTSLFVLGDPERVPLLKSLRASIPEAFPSSRAGPEATILCSARNPVDPAEFVTTFVGAPEALSARARAVFYYQFDGRIAFEGRVPKERGDAHGKSHTAAFVLPDLGTDVSAERVRSVVDRLTTPEMAGRLAGSAAERAARAVAVSELTLAGLKPREEEFRFVVRDLDPDSPALRVGGEAVAGAIPLTHSPTTPEGGVTASRVVREMEPGLAGAAVLVDLPPDREDAHGFAVELAATARDMGAGALLLRAPESAGRKASEAWEFPSNLHPELAKRLADGRARGRHGDPLVHAAGTAARTAEAGVPAIPVVLVPHGWEPPVQGSVLVTVRFREEVVRSANVVARIPGARGEAGGVVVLAAHLDHLGEGFPGADDNASGVAAVIEAARLLSAHAHLLGRDVVVLMPGAEEWGLRGARAFLAGREGGPGIAAMVNADTVGRRGVPEVHVVGVSHHPRLAAILSAALGQSGLRVGADIDRFAFAYGSDHWAFHHAGVPAVSLWSGDYSAMHTTGDTPDLVDEMKVTSVARALAMTVLAASGGF